MNDNQMIQLRNHVRAVARHHLPDEIDHWRNSDMPDNHIVEEWVGLLECVGLKVADSADQLRPELTLV